MPRAERVDVKDYYYHVLNRANARLTLFEKPREYGLFESALEEAREKYNMRVIAYCCMPNHFHLILQPQEDGDLSKFMYWFSMTLTLRWHALQRTTGSGHIFQGRYKSFLIQEDVHLLSVMRYVERNPLRAHLVKYVENWKYSSLYRRLKGTPKQKKILTDPEIILPRDYRKFIQEPISEDEINMIRNSISKNTPYGNSLWKDRMVDRFKLQATVRERGRPKGK